MGLCCEVGKIPNPQCAAPEFASEQFHHLRGGDSFVGLVLLPPGVGQGALALVPIGGMDGQLKVGVGRGLLSRAVIPRSTIGAVGLLSLIHI